MFRSARLCEAVPKVEKRIEKLLLAFDFAAEPLQTRACRLGELDLTRKPVSNGQSITCSDSFVLEW